MTIKKEWFVLKIEYTQTPDWRELFESVERHIISKSNVVSVSINEDFEDICRDIICDDCEERMGEPMRNEGYD